ncbi:carboxymuconolactone decarboxylase family protein [Micromonospora echinofusca]|uniref:Carboxymuconolactone decarboxylase family protein n=1 Tax=Micromonospora echinofusca TaxID=47858 RepID=A0ABS3VVI7_MICEH|nr:carboxymuconolactone decarboxylase family protein [Micromonospora echinofusca]MBO4208538.1 carboxymuconolactone decarboxylase family protein [Micromonospora echinofusca]
MTTERLRRLRPGTLDAAQRRLYDAIVAGPRAQTAAVLPVTDADGGLEGPFNPLLYSPELGMAVQRVGAQIRAGLSLTNRERELVTLRCAVLCHSRYEIEAHSRLAVASGVTPAELEALIGSRLPEPLVDRDRLLLALGSAVVTGGGLDDHLYTQAVRALGERAVVEIVLLAGYYVMLAALLDAFRVAPPASSDRIVGSEPAAPDPGD